MVSDFKTKGYTAADDAHLSKEYIHHDILFIMVDSVHLKIRCIANESSISRYYAGAVRFCNRKSLG